MANPFVLTLELDHGSFRSLDALRRAHMPPGRNQVPAHVTLFHQLPGERAREVKALLRDLAAATRPLELTIETPRLLGDTGVAFPVKCAALHALRDRLADEVWPWLTPQDQARFNPHVTVQNKVSRADAETLRRALAAGHRAWTAKGEGLHLWRYEGGPWKSEAVFPFGR